MDQVRDAAVAFLNLPGSHGSREQPQLGDPELPPQWGRDPTPVSATERRENGSHCTTAAP